MPFLFETRHFCDSKYIIELRMTWLFSLSLSLSRCWKIWYTQQLLSEIYSVLILAYHLWIFEILSMCESSYCSVFLFFFKGGWHICMTLWQILRLIFYKQKFKNMTPIRVIEPSHTRVIMNGLHNLYVKMITFQPLNN